MAPSYPDGFENRFKSIEDSHKKQNDLTQFILQSAYNGEFYRPMNTYTGIRSNPNIEKIDENDYDYEDDNDDVPTTGGSDTFKSYNNDHDNNFDNENNENFDNENNENFDNENNNNFDNENVSEQFGIRAPEFNLDSIFPQDKQFTVTPDEQAYILNNNEDEETKSTDVEPAQDQEPEPDAEEQPEQPEQPEPEEQEQPEPEQPPQTSYEKQKQKLLALKQEYTSLGGNDIDILRKKDQKSIKHAIELLKTEQELKRVKKARKKLKSKK